uniref:SAM domain-containing protein n=1 Tax=Parastrongyloides trichosuri TaxID=131310 RepID=A0A0N5A175_PARTI
MTRTRNHLNRLPLKSVLLYLLFLSYSSCKEENLKIKNVVVTAEQEKLRDKEGYAAIAELHKQMDDDKSGSIDRAESSDFLTADLHIGGSDRARREKHFHNNNDDSITVDELWETFFLSEERYWNEEKMIDWLINSVKLPQYIDNFRKAKVTGIYLPRMALPSGAFLSETMGIRNYVHRQKIQLKALDVVLFGYIDSSNKLKDAILGLLVCTLLAVILFFNRQQNKAKMEMAQLSSKLGELKNLETEFNDSQRKFDEERKKRQSTCDTLSNEQVNILKSKLEAAEKKLEHASVSSGSIELTLQPLLRRTYELEYSHIQQQKIECLTEMREAKELVDKFRRKQSGVMYSLKLATGATSGTEVIDTKIFSLKTRMEKITLALDECTQRWVDIEMLCGFPIISSNDSGRSLSKTKISLNGIPSSSTGTSTTSKLSNIGSHVASFSNLYSNNSISNSNINGIVRKGGDYDEINSSSSSSSSGASSSVYSTRTHQKNNSTANVRKNIISTTKQSGCLPSSSSGTNLSNVSSTSSKYIKKLSVSSTIDTNSIRSNLLKKTDQSSEESVGPPNTVYFTLNSSSIHTVSEGDGCVDSSNYSSSNISEDQSSYCESKSGKENKLEGKMKKVKKTIKNIKLFKSNKT